MPTPNGWAPFILLGNPEQDVAPRREAHRLINIELAEVARSVEEAAPRQPHLRGAGTGLWRLHIGMLASCSQAHARKRRRTATETFLVRAAPFVENTQRR